MANPNYTPLSNLELARQCLEQLDAIIPQIVAGVEISSYSVAGRSFTLRDPADAMKQRQEWFRIFTEETTGDATYADARTFNVGTR